MSKETNGKSIALTILVWICLVFFVVGCIAALCNPSIGKDQVMKIGDIELTGNNIGLFISFLCAYILVAVIGKTQNVEIFANPNPPPVSI